MTGWWLAPEDERMRHFDFLLQKPFDVKQARRVIDNAVAMIRLRHDTIAKP
jgi:hypothetical protein